MLTKNQVYSNIGTSALAVSNNNDIHPDSPIHHINLDTTNEEKVYVQDNDSNDQSSYRVPIYEYHWKITSKSIYRRKFGSWREGPQPLYQENILSA